MARAYQPGDHICALFETEDEHYAIAADYVADGLCRGERCLYASASAAGPGRMHEALAARGVDAAEALERGALVLLTAAEAHLASGRFDPELMMGFLNDGVEAALKDGFTALRTCGDMSWLLDTPEGSDRVVEYEIFLNQFFQGVRAAGMCLFDRARLPPALIDQAIAAHTSAHLSGQHVFNPFYEPSASASRVPEPERVEAKLRVLAKSS